MSRDLADLEALASLVFDAELARLNALSEELAARQISLSELAAARAARRMSLCDDEARQDLAFLTGQDMLWEDWLAQTGARLSREVAQAAARREDQRLKAQKAFGKRDALRQIRERDEMELRRAQARRAGI